MGLICPEDTVDTKRGRVRYYDRIMKDAHEDLHTKVTVRRAFELSLNTGISLAVTKAYGKEPKKFIEGLKLVSDKFEKDVLVSVHPRRADKLSRFGIGVDGTNIRLLEPFGFFDFVKLEKNSFGVLTDSGTVQEECAIFGVPNVTLRDVTERPETIECGSNIIAGAEPESILRSVTLAVEQASFWQTHSEYLTPNCSQIVSRVVLGYTSLRRHH